MRVKSRFTSRYQSRYQSRFVAGLGGPSGSTGVPQPYVIAPSITSPSDAATDIGETPTITSSAFSVANDGSDTHATSDWQIASDSGFNTIVVQSLDDATNKTSWTVPGGNLEVDTTYYVRVRHTGTTYGDSAWSATISFTTAASFAYSWTNAEGETFEDNADGTGWDDDLRGDIDQLISDLKNGQINGSNVYSGFDRILLMDLPNSSDSLRYLNASTLTATNVSATAHAANEGFTGDGSADYINTNFTPSSNGVQYTLNSCSMAAWVRTVGASVGLGAYAGGEGSAGISSRVIVKRGVDGSAWGVFGPQSATGVNGTTASESATGLLGANRSASNAIQAYRNGASEGSDTDASGSLSDDPIFILANNDSGAELFSTGQVSIWFAGRSFTANEWADIYDAFNRYRTAREAA